MDTTLATTEEKYHLYMLEIELVNRIYREEFKARRIQVRPHRPLPARLQAGVPLGKG